MSYIHWLAAKGLDPQANPSGCPRSHSRLKSPGKAEAHLSFDRMEGPVSTIPQGAVYRDHGIHQ